MRIYIQPISHIQHIATFKVAALDERNSVVIVSHDLAYHYRPPGYALLAPECDAAGQWCLAGATSSKQHQLNLVEMGLDWQHGILAKLEFMLLIKHLKNGIRNT